MLSAASSACCERALSKFPCSLSCVSIPLAALNLAQKAAASDVDTVAGWACFSYASTCRLLQSVGTGSRRGLGAWPVESISRAASGGGDVEAVVLGGSRSTPWPAGDFAAGVKWAPTGEVVVPA